MTCWNSKVCRALRSLVDNPKRAVNWAGLANGAGLFGVSAMMVAWGFGAGDSAAVAVVTEPLKQLGFVMGGIGAVVVLTNLGFTNFKITTPGGATVEANQEEDNSQ